MTYSETNPAPGTCRPHGIMEPCYICDPVENGIVAEAEEVLREANSGTHN